MCTNLTSELQLTDGLLTDQLTKRSRNRPLDDLDKNRTFTKTACLSASVPIQNLYQRKCLLLKYVQTRA